MVAARVLLNNLPFPLRQAKNIESFKHLCKTYVFIFSGILLDFIGTFYFIFIFCNSIKFFVLFLFFIYLLYFFRTHVYILPNRYIRVYSFNIFLHTFFIK